MLHVSIGGEGVFQMGGFIFKWGDAPWGALVLMEGGVFDKNLWIMDIMGVPPPVPPHYGKRCNIC